MTNTFHGFTCTKDADEADGFTLIELLIVIVVLGILAAVVIFALGGITGKSATAACQADGATISTAMAVYNAQNGANPATDAALVGNGLQSWPSNSPHYAFGIVSGVLYVDIPYNSTWNGTPTATGTGVARYTGPSSCTGLS
jgi:prepilin-type N-terminal cleavage/methylation domain-containing protein